MEVYVDFGAEGEPAKNITYKAKVYSKAKEEEIRELIKYTDSVAEIQNSLRIETPVILNNIEIMNL